MKYFYDECALKGIYGNRIWITKEDYINNQVIVQFFKILSSWGYIDRECGDNVSFELTRGIGEEILDLLQKRFSLDTCVTKYEDLNKETI